MSWCEFSLNANEQKDYKQWWERHKLECPDYEKTNMGARTFCFTPLGFGTAIKVRCSCGAVHEIIDPDFWENL